MLDGTLDSNTQARTHATRFLLIPSLAILAGVFGYLLIYHIHHQRHDQGHFGDFPTFYHAAEYAREHRDIYKAGNAAMDQMYVYPPLIAFLYVPLTHLSLPHAAMVMLLLTWLMLLGSVLLGATAMLGRLGGKSVPAVCVVAAIVAVFSENELRTVTTMLETDALMLLLFTLALRWLDRRPIRAGLALAMGLNIKYLSIITLPYLLLRRRGRAAAGLVLGSVFFALLPALQLGMREDLRCLGVSAGGLPRLVGVNPGRPSEVVVHKVADTLSVSITSALARMLGRIGLSTPMIFAVAGGIGLIALAIVAALYRRGRFPLFDWPGSDGQRSEPFEGLIALEWAGLMAFTLAFSPNTNGRHLVLTVLVNCFGATLLVLPRPTVPRAIALIGMLVIFIGYILPPDKERHFGHNHYFYGVPCWCLLIGYLLVLWTGLRFIRASMDSTDSTRDIMPRPTERFN